MSSSKVTSTKKRLEWSTLAILNRDGLVRYIAVDENNPINAQLVDGRILAAAARIKQFPLSGKPWDKSLRLVFVPRTQCTIVYRVNEQSVRILRISHQKMKKP